MSSTQSQIQDASTTLDHGIVLPRITIKFCTQCKWNLRAAYYAQELLQTFSTSIGEISLIPVTGGIFTVTLYHIQAKTLADTSESLTPSGVLEIPPPPIVLEAGLESNPTDLSAATEHAPSNIGDEDTHPQSSKLNNHLNTNTPPNPIKPKIQETILWDRKTENGFPETKQLKNRLRNIIEPNRNLGHIDRSLQKDSKPQSEDVQSTTDLKSNGDKQKTQDTDKYKSDQKEKDDISNQAQNNREMIPNEKEQSEENDETTTGKVMRVGKEGVLVSAGSGAKIGQGSGTTDIKTVYGENVVAEDIPVASGRTKMVDCEDCK